MSSALNGTGITFSNGSTQSVAWPGNTGTVTSVATGNGLSGGTITTTGTLVIAAPTFNSVGSYTFAYKNTSGDIAVGNTASGAVISYCEIVCPDSGAGGAYLSPMGTLTGTWRAMGYAQGYDSSSPRAYGIIWCRVS